MFELFGDYRYSQSGSTLPHGLAPSETMVWDHGLNPPLSTENPRSKGFSGSGAPIFWIWSRRPRAQGVGVDPIAWVIGFRAQQIHVHDSHSFCLLSK